MLPHCWATTLEILVHLLRLWDEPAARVGVIVVCRWCYWWGHPVVGHGAQIDGVDALNNILLIGMTNRKDMLDEALLRYVARCLPACLSMSQGDGEGAELGPPHLLPCVFPHVCGQKGGRPTERGQANRKGAGQQKGGRPTSGPSRAPSTAWMLWAGMGASGAVVLGPCPSLPPWTGCLCSLLVALPGSPGRLEVQVEIGLPDEEGRFKILRIHSAKMKENSFLSADVDLTVLGEARCRLLIALCLGLPGQEHVDGMCPFAGLESWIASALLQLLRRRTSAVPSWRGW